MSGSAVAAMDADERNDLNPSGQKARGTGKTSRSGGSGPLERITVNLVARAARALQKAADLTGDSKTDTINRAVQVYAYLEEINSRGGTIYIREADGAELERLKML